uniref:Putative cytochrome c oxidase subunit 8 isoform a n=1 Tax=Haematobia irritans TaxID=7368 RepID=A0A1L8EHM9_HAEIR
MFQKSAAVLLAPAIRNAVQRRCQSVVSSPPTQKVSSAEKLFLGGCMFVSTLVIPAWVLYHIREYRGLK